MFEIRHAYHSNSFTSLQEALLLHRHSDALDPPDRIYALLGIITDPQEANVLPNYALSTAEVYKEAVVNLLEYGRSGLLLHAAE
jgi:hypothetical protein